MPQSYSPEDDQAHIRALLPALSDPRAIRVDGKPLLLVYQGWVLPDAARTMATWRTEAVREGLGDLHLLAVETGWDAGWDATTVGFDGKVLFQPQFTLLRETRRQSIPEHPGLQVYDYNTAWPHLGAARDVPYPFFETVFPMWDNTPRQGAYGTVVHDASVSSFEHWLQEAVDRARQRPRHQRIVFINAWNEWAEGCYLEPDEANGAARLDAVSRVVRRPPGRDSVRAAARPGGGNTLGAAPRVRKS
jgi:hypothetical protein